MQDKDTSEEETHQANEMHSLGLKSTTSPTKPESNMCSTKDMPEATPTRLSYESKDIMKDVEYSPLYPLCRISFYQLRGYMIICLQFRMDKIGILFHADVFADRSGLFAHSTAERISA